MANKTVEALARCPFFEEATKDTVMCEGYCENTCMITRFSSVKAKRAHMKENCYLDDGGACFMARALFEKYEALHAADLARRAAALHEKAEACRLEKLKR